MFPCTSMGQTFITHSAVKITFVFVEKSEDISIADMKHQLFHVRGEAFGRLSLVEKRRQLWDERSHQMEGSSILEHTT